MQVGVYFVALHMKYWKF